MASRCLSRCLLMAAVAVAMRAPDVAPDLPDGWCVGGTPTATTGECMCRSTCEGPRCRNEQGFVWYAYKECPSCKCVAAAPKAPEAGGGAAAPAAPAKRGADDEPSDDEEGYVPYEGQHDPFGFEGEDGPELSPLEAALEWIDENSRAIFAGVAALGALPSRAAPPTPPSH